MTGEPQDTCRIVDIDGQPIRVHGAQPLDEKGRAALAEVIAAVQRRMADADPGCPYCGDLYDPNQPNLHARCRQIPDAEARRDGRE